MISHQCLHPRCLVVAAVFATLSAADARGATPSAQSPTPPQMVREVIGKVSQGKLEIAVGPKHAQGAEVHYRERHYADGRIEVLLFKDAKLSEPLAAKVTVKRRISNASVVAVVETTLNQRAANFEIRLAKKEGFNIANIGPIQPPSDPQWYNPRNEGQVEMDRTNYPWGWPSYSDADEFTFWVFGYTVYFTDPGLGDP